MNYLGSLAGFGIWRLRDDLGDDGFQNVIEHENWGVTPRSNVERVYKQNRTVACCDRLEKINKTYSYQTIITFYLDH